MSNSAHDDEAELLRKRSRQRRRGLFLSIISIPFVLFGGINAVIGYARSNILDASYASIFTVGIVLYVVAIVLVRRGRLPKFHSNEAIGRASDYIVERRVYSFLACCVMSIVIVVPIILSSLHITAGLAQPLEISAIGVGVFLLFVLALLVSRPARNRQTSPVLEDEPSLTVRMKGQSASYWATFIGAAILYGVAVFWGDKWAFVGLPLLLVTAVIVPALYLLCSDVKALRDKSR